MRLPIPFGLCEIMDIGDASYIGLLILIAGRRLMLQSIQPLRNIFGHFRTLALNFQKQFTLEQNLEVYLKVWIMVIILNW
ncbi:MAG TPA: hypothetical protein ACFCUD_03570 [Cyclobacteriaceae bacterium]